MPLIDATTRARWQARAWLAIGRSDRALAAIDRLLAAMPDDAWGLASRAHLHAQAGRRAAAIADLQALVARQPQRSAADWFNLGYLLEADDRPADAEAAFRAALALDGRLDRAWYGLGLVLVRLDRPDEAAAALKRTTELQPMSPHGWYQLARLHAFGQRRDEALRIIRHLRGFEPRVAAQLERETGLQA
jgi:tetratricopeptide (TPR) repeat protein